MICSKTGMTALIAASSRNMSEIVKLLLKKKINLDLQDMVNLLLRQPYTAIQRFTTFLTAPLSTTARPDSPPCCKFRRICRHRGAAHKEKAQLEPARCSESHKANTHAPHMPLFVLYIHHILFSTQFTFAGRMHRSALCLLRWS